MGEADRQRECKRRSLPHFALHPDFSAVHFDEFPGQAQSQPGALAFLSVVSPYLTKLLKDCFVIFRRDADARVGDRNDYHTVAQRRLNLDLPAFGRELDSIGEQVD